MTKLSASSAASKSAGRFNRPELNVLRFFAFLLVFACHTLPNPSIQSLSGRVTHALKYSGALGVPVFFLLSAYLITELLYRERERTGDINLKWFYARRVLRIWPLYFAILGLGITAGFVIPGFPRIAPRAIIAYLFLLGNSYSATHGYLPGFTISLWSISVEEQFYLVLPSVARVVSKSRLAVLSAGVWVASIISTGIIASHHVPMMPRIWFSSLVQFQYFALGALLCIALRGSVPKMTWWLRAALLGAGLLTFFACTFVFHASDPDFQSTTGSAMAGYSLAGVGAVLIFLSFAGATIPTWAGALNELGKISYGLYMYHLIFADATRKLLIERLHLVHLRSAPLWLIALPLTILASHLSYKYFESPFLELKKHFEIVKTGPKEIAQEGVVPGD